MEPHALQAAYVLHTRRYGDSSLLVDLLTRDQGRVVCIRKGALRTRSGGPPIQPFHPLLVQLYGRGEVLTLARAEAAGSAAPLTGRGLYCGIYLNELLLRLTARQDPAPGLFDDYAAAVSALGSESAGEPVLRRFEVRLLQHLGLGLSLQVDTAGQPIDPASRYNYDVDSGPSLAMDGLEPGVSGATLLALETGRFDGDSMREARLLMRRILHHHLDGRPLRSRELFR